MDQFSMRMKKEDLEVLQLVSKETKASLTSLYHQATSRAFNEWKLDQLLRYYRNGHLGLKKTWKLSCLSWNSFLLELEQRNIEPPISKMVDDYTDSIRKQIDLGKHYKHQK